MASYQSLRQNCECSHIILIEESLWEYFFTQFLYDGHILTDSLPSDTQINRRIELKQDVENPFLRKVEQKNALLICFRPRGFEVLDRIT